MSVSPEDSTACWSGLSGISKGDPVSSLTTPWPLAGADSSQLWPFHVS